MRVVSDEPEREHGSDHDHHDDDSDGDVRGVVRGDEVGNRGSVSGQDRDDLESGVLPARRHRREERSGAGAHAHSREREQRLRALWLASCGEHAISATHQGFEDEDFFDFWPHVPAHTVLIHGAESPVVTPSNAQEAASAHPSAHLLEIPDAGHMVYWDNPVTALSVTRDALRKLLATS